MSTGRAAFDAPNVLPQLRLALAARGVALALLAVGALGHVLSRRALTLAGSFFIAGILLFSGSLYALSLTGERPFPFMTPAGGICFILGWLTLAVAAMATARRH